MEHDDNNCALITLRGGPYDGERARVTENAYRSTLTFTAKGMTGFYRFGLWVEA